MSPPRTPPHRTLRAAAIVATVAALASGCAPQPAEPSFDEWSQDMQTTLSTRLGSPGAGGAGGGMVQLDVGEAGDHSVAAACRSAESATITLSSGDLTTELDVVCGTSTPVDVTLPIAQATMVVDADVDWYVVFNR